MLVVSFHIFTLLMTIRKVQWTMSYIYPLSFFPWSCIYYYVHKKYKFVAIFILDNQDYEDVTAAQGKTV